MLYDCGFFPDWSFRRDQVEVIAATEHELHEVQDNYLSERLSERDPEMAFYKFAPGETVFMAGEVYCIKPDGPFESIVFNNNSFRSYKKLRAEKQVLCAARNKERRKYDQKVYVAKLPSFLDKGKILSIAYDPACRISFINYGCLRHKKTEPFEDAEGSTFKFGYSIIRQAVLLRFDPAVGAEPQWYYSLVSAIGLAIRDFYHLDESDIRILVDIHPLSEKIDSSLYVLIYDNEGNGNVPLKRVFSDFDKVVSFAHDRIKNCTGSSDHPCQNGCYNCLKSYGTRVFASQVDKQKALTFTGYLLGMNELNIIQDHPEVVIKEFDLELKLEKHGDTVTICGMGRKYQEKVIEADQNKVIFDSLTDVIQAEFKERMRNLKIIANLSYVVNAINDGHIDKNKDAFNRFQFNALDSMW